MNALLDSSGVRLRRFVGRHGFALSCVVLFMALAWLHTPGLLTGGTIWDERLAEYVPWRIELGRLLREGQPPWFTDRAFGGMPVLGLAYVGALYPPNWLYTFFHAGLANWLEAFHTFLGALGMFLYLRSLRISRVAVLVGAVVFISQTFFMTHACHVSMREACLWAPWAAWLARRLLRRPGAGRCAALAAVLAIQVSVGYPQMVLMTTCWVGLEWLASLRRRRWRAQTLWLAAAGVVGVGLMGVQISVSREVVENTLRATMSLEDWEDTPFRPIYAIIFFAPRAFSTPVREWLGGDWAGEVWQTLPSAGWALAVLAVVACAARWGLGRGARRRFGLVYGAGVLAAFVLSVGELFPPNLLLFHVPPFSLFRVPSRWLFLAGTLTSVLAGLGVHVSLRWSAWRRGAAFLGCWVGWGLTCIAVSLAASSEWSGVAGALDQAREWLFDRDPWEFREITIFLQRRQLPWFGGILDMDEIHYALALLVGAGLMMARRQPRLAMLGLAIVLGFDWWVMHKKGYFDPKPWETLTRWERNEFLQDLNRDEIGRFYSVTPKPYDLARLVIPPGMHLYHELDSLGGYCPLVSANFCARFWTDQKSSCARDGEFYGNPTPLEMIGVTHLAVNEAELSPERDADYRANLGRLYEEVHRADGKVLLRLLRAPPRFDLAARWSEIERPEQADELLWSGNHPAGEKQALLENPDRDRLPREGRRLGGGAATPLVVRGSYQRVRVRSFKRGVLLIRDGWWPGWQYRIAGGDEGWRAVERANGLVRYAPVPPGHSVVEMRYVPPGLGRGLKTSMVALSAWLALAAAGLWWRGPPPWRRFRSVSVMLRRCCSRAALRRGGAGLSRRVSRHGLLVAVTAGLICWTVAAAHWLAIDSIYSADSGDIQNVPPRFGIMHPPGYSVLVLAGGVFSGATSWLFDDPARAMNVFNVIGASAGLAALMAFAARLGAGPFWSIAAPLAILLRRVNVSLIIVPEVYWFYAALYFAALHAVYRAGRRRAGCNGALAAGLLFGMYVSGRIYAAPLFAFFALWLAWREGSGRARFRRVCFFGTGMAIPLLVCFLHLRVQAASYSHTNYLWSYLSVIEKPGGPLWSRLGDLDYAAWWQLSAGRFHQTLGGMTAPLAAFGALWKALAGPGPAGALVLAVLAAGALAGMWRLARRRGGAALLIGGAVAWEVVFFLLYQPGDMATMLVPLWGLLGLLAAVGFRRAGALWPVRLRAPRLPSSGRHALAASLAWLIVGGAVLITTNPTPERLFSERCLGEARSILSPPDDASGEALPWGAYVLLDWGMYCQAVYSAEYLRARPDLRISHALDPWLALDLVDRYHDRGPVFFRSSEPFRERVHAAIESRYEIRPRGNLYEVVGVRTPGR